MNRKQKIKKLEESKARTAPETLKDFTVLAKIMAETVADFKKTLKAGVQIEDLDVLFDRLGRISELKGSVDALAATVAAFPEIPKEIKIATVNEFIAAIEGIKLEPHINLPEQKQNLKIPDYSASVDKLAEAVARMAQTLKAAGQDKSQKAKDFLPFRRVIAKGNTYMFDDEPTSRGGGGSGGGVPLLNSDDGQPAVPIINANNFNVLPYSEILTNDDTIAPSASNIRLKVVKILIVPDPDNDASNLVQLSFPTLGVFLQGWTLSSSIEWVGQPGESLTINLATNEPVSVNIQYKEIESA